MEGHDCLDGFEDANAHQIIQRDQSDGDYLFFAVMNGHGSRETSQLLSRILIKATALEIANLSTSFKPGVLASLMGTQSSSPGDADPTQMSLAIQKAFENLDSEILKASLRVLAENTDTELRKLSKIPDTMLPAISGSCALLAVFDTAHRNLYIACTGDSRTVAGVWEPSADGTGAWPVDVLSEDQTGRNPKELERIRSEAASSHWTDWNSSKLSIHIAFPGRCRGSLPLGINGIGLGALSLAGTMFPRILSPTIIPRRNVKIYIDDFLAVISKRFPNLRILCFMDIHQALIWTPPRVPSCIESSPDLPFEDVVTCTRWLAWRISEASPSILKVSVRESNSSAARPLQSHIRSVVKTCREI
ncbi:hypothetical protein C8J56DRAFT_1034278 [Mycena floridula]|nr:hypothetical protein C8J56DRAFT_1034278 [Mycena floridula]